MKFIFPVRSIFISLLIPFLFLFGPTAASAQSNFYKFGIGAGAGATQSFADVYNKGTSIAGYAAVDFYFTPYFNIGLEYQKGEIRGGDEHDANVYYREFSNQYQAIILHSKVQLGTFVDYQRSGFLNAIRGLYVGTGLGVIENNHRFSIRRSEILNETFPGLDYSIEAFLPLNLGINIYYPDRVGSNRLVLNINYQTNIAFGEGLDSYDNSIKTFKTGMPDMYLFLSAGLRYHFGIIGLSRKSFRKY